jgi:hypothetical protein
VTAKQYHVYDECADPLCLTCAWMRTYREARRRGADHDYAAELAREAWNEAARRKNAAVTK